MDYHTSRRLWEGANICGAPGAQKGMNLATLLDVQNKDQPQIENLYKKKLLKKKNVHTYADFLDQDAADVEDLFDRDFYVDLVNREFTRQLASPIDPQKLSTKEPRTLKVVEAYLEAKSNEIRNLQPLSSGALSFRADRQSLGRNV